jgi:4-hydroxybenzoate polyprenyltransferase
MNMQRETIETTVLSLSNKSVLAGSVTSVLGWLAQSGMTALVAMLVAVLGLLINAWFQLRRDRREQREHERRMWLMKTSPQPPEVSE